MFKHWLRKQVEAAILRLSNRGDISVTVIHKTVTDKKGCAACNGTGRMIPYIGDVKQRDMTQNSLHLCLCLNKVFVLHVKEKDNVDSCIWTISTIGRNMYYPFPSCLCFC